MACDTAGLLAKGWERRSVACEPRLSEVCALYGELGLEVLCVPVLEVCPPGLSGECTECFSGDADPARFKVVFTRGGKLPQEGGRR